MTLTRAGAGLQLAALAALLLASLAALAGCHPAEPGTPKQVGVPPKTITVEPPEEPAPLALPECEAINLAAEAEQQAFLDSVGPENITGSYGETDRALFTEFASPAALTAVESVVQERNCNWVIYLDSVYLFQFTAELPQSAMAPLFAELRNEGFTETERGDARVFTVALATGDMRGIMGVTHAFIGDIWITLVENSVGDYAQSALESVVAANPELADSLGALHGEHPADPDAE
ncbi:hypothetical protein ACI1US_01110 [Leucobacter sp. BZR 635]